MTTKTKRQEQSQGRKALRGGKRIGSRDKLFEELSTDYSWNSFMALIFGAPGCGKTWLCGTAVDVPELSPVLLIDNDGGSRTVRGKSQFQGISIWRVYEFEAYNQIYAKILADPGQFKTVIIDNLGALYNMVMDMEMEEVCANDQSREPDVPSQREYMICRGIIRKLTKFFSDLGENGINIIFTCHVEMDKSEMDKIKKIRPALAGKLAFEVPGNLPIVGYMTGETVRQTQALGTRRKEVSAPTIVRKIIFQPHNNVDAKDQSDKLGFEMIDPTMLKIAQAIGISK